MHASSFTCSPLRYWLQRHCFEAMVQPWLHCCNSLLHLADQLRSCAKPMEWDTHFCNREGITCGHGTIIGFLIRCQDFRFQQLLIVRLFSYLFTCMHFVTSRWVFFTMLLHVIFILGCYTYPFIYSLWVFNYVSSWGLPFSRLLEGCFDPFLLWASQTNFLFRYD